MAEEMAARQPKPAQARMERDERRTRSGSKRSNRPRRGGFKHSDEYRQAMPARLAEWGADDKLWELVKNKNALRRLARDGDEENGRRRIASLRAKLGLSAPAGKCC